MLDFVVFALFIRWKYHMINDYHVCLTFCRLNKCINCVSEIQIWMKANFLKLNAERIEMIILSSPYFAKARTHDMIINLNGDLIHPNRAVRNLGVICDNTMNMESHVNKICQTAYIHLRNI